MEEEGQTMQWPKIKGTTGHTNDLQNTTQEIK